MANALDSNMREQTINPDTSNEQPSGQLERTAVIRKATVRIGVGLLTLAATIFVSPGRLDGVMA